MQEAMLRNCEILTESSSCYAIEWHVSNPPYFVLHTGNGVWSNYIGAGVCIPAKPEDRDARHRTHRVCSHERLARDGGQRLLLSSPREQAV